MAGVPATAEEQMQGKPLVNPQVDEVWRVFQVQTTAHNVGKVTLRLPKEAEEAVRIQYFDSHAPHTSAVNTIKIDPTSSRLLMHERYEDKQTGGRLIASMLAIHKGGYFGPVGSLLLMLSSLALPVFVVTGWMMYLDRRRVEERARKRQAADAATA
jgi:sulfite reductase (NADPH) flavoprotein alpha-component